jgi:hypothetical protein
MGVLRFIRNIHATIVEGIDNQSKLLDDRLAALVQGIDNQSNLLDRSLSALVCGIDNQSNLLDRSLSALVCGIDNQSKLLDDRLAALIQGVDNQSKSLGTLVQLCDAITELQRAQLVVQQEQAEVLDRVAVSAADFASATKDLLKRER